MHGKTDSDVTSLPGSSPTRSSPPRRPSGPVYYVQSPSRDSTSHDGEKITNSFHSTPMISPMGSPPRSHSNSSLGPHSRESSSTRFSGSAKPPSGAKDATGKGGSGRSQRWKDHHHRHGHHPFDAIEEENLLAGDEAGREGGISRRCCYSIAFVVAFFVLFTFFSLVLWGVSRNQKPLISIKSVKFEDFDIQAGQDAHGVPTAMASTNATVKLAYKNRGTFFGVHVTSTPLELSFEDLILASGGMDYFYETRKSTRQITVQVIGTSVPLYGGAYSMSTTDQGPTSPVPLSLNFTVRSRAYVLGRLVKPKFYRSISCAIIMDPKKMNKALSLKNNCTYT